MPDYDAVARPYAQAVFELAREAGTLAAWSEILDTAAELATHADFAQLLATPGMDNRRIADTIVEICVGEGAGIEVKNFIRLLAENRRLLALPAIAARFNKLRADVENTVHVVLTAATPVDEAQQHRMIEVLRKRFGRDVKLQFKLDTNLIGGARLQAEDLVIDGSVRTGLDKLSSALVH